MDYNYIRLENQIKALMNKNYSSTSAVAQIAQQLQVGNFQLFVDTVNKQFVFKYHSVNNPIGIDAINNKIVNVKYINDVDISKLVSAITSGYGIVVDDMGNGVFKVSVDENKFATKDEMNAVDSKFANYATKDEMNIIDRKFDDYATKTELNDINSKFDDYSLTADIQSTYATKDQMKAVDVRFNDYTTTTDLESAYLRKEDLPSSDTKFTIDEGFPYFTVRNEHISTNNNYVYDGHEYNVLMIKIPDDIKQQIYSKATQQMNVLKIILRKNIIYDAEGNLNKEFICYINNDKAYCPSIVFRSDGIGCDIANVAMFDDEFFIAFDNNLSFNPHFVYER